jgi:hypothetical protein
MTPTPFAPGEPVLRIGGPADIIDAIPYLLGFHPRDSLVLIGMGSGRLVCTMRMDLADALPGDPLNGTLPHTMAQMADGGASLFFAAIFDDHADGHQEAAIQLLTARADLIAEDLGCCLREALLVSRQRWWSVWCEDERCCPVEGNPVLTGTSVFGAEATYAGMGVAADRDALAAGLEPAPGREELLPAIRRYEQEAVQSIMDGSADFWRKRAEHDVRIAAAAASGRPASPLPEQDVARLGVALQDIAVRDAVWMGVDARRIDGEALCRELARRLPAPYDAPPLFLLGWQSWRGGNGAIANIAADRTLASDPGYSAARLLIQVVCEGINPGTMPLLGTEEAEQRLPAGARTRRKRR